MKRRYVCANGGASWAALVSLGIMLAVVLSAYANRENPPSPQKSTTVVVNQGAGLVTSMRSVADPRGDGGVAGGACPNLAYDNGTYNLTNGGRPTAGWTDAGMIDDFETTVPIGFSCVQVGMLDDTGMTDLQTMRIQIFDLNDIDGAGGGDGTLPGAGSYAAAVPVCDNTYSVAAGTLTMFDTGDDAFGFDALLFDATGPKCDLPAGDYGFHLTFPGTGAVDFWMTADSAGVSPACAQVWGTAVDLPADFGCAASPEFLTMHFKLSQTGVVVCGDGVCDAPFEDCQGCPEDCGPCPPGACCNSDGMGGCTVETAEACAALGGNFLGSGTSCNDCPLKVCGPGAGSCQVPHQSPGCDDADCCEAVCQINPACCTKQWTALCVQIAEKLPDCQVSGDPVFIATGPSSSVDGYLDVLPDVYGSYAVAFGGGPNWDDHYNPVGPAGSQEAAFTSGLYLFVGDTQRELLSAHSGWQGTFPGDGSLDTIVTAANSPSDTNGDGVNDTLTSGFNVSGGDTDLSFDVTQHVERIVPLSGNTVAILTQDYTITNNSTLPIVFELVSTFDGDLLWVGDFEDDTVGTGTNGSPGVDRYVYEGEVGQPTQTITISSPTGAAYTGSKLGFVPDPGDPNCPAYGFGTDVQVWEAYGIPDCWRNHIAIIGYDTDGESGGSPPDCGVRCDALALLEIPVSLAAGATTTVAVTHTYGANAPVGGGLPCPWDLNGSGDVGILDLLALLAAWGPNPGDPADFDGNGTVDIFDLLTLIANWGACP